MENMGQMIEHKKQEKPPKAKQSRKPCSETLDFLNKNF